VSTASDLRAGRVADEIRRGRLIVVLRRIEPRERLLGLVDELAEAGARAFEVTLDAASGEEELVALRSHLAGRDDGPFLVGAGTVAGPEQLEAARRARADFAVAPILDVGLLRASIASGLPFIPGALTPTEIWTAWTAGATFVKLFPASSLGPAHVRELRGPMPDVALIPTGGVDGSTAGAFLDAGAAAVGMGGALVDGDAASRRAIISAVATP
jgi:2-dehydro-3-deoxyphosphogluconate aldolase/(4S)-4-hydroxy-2-oxoglutarate aldolase